MGRFRVKMKGFGVKKKSGGKKGKILGSQRFQGPKGGIWGQKKGFRVKRKDFGVKRGVFGASCPPLQPPPPLLPFPNPPRNEGKPRGTHPKKILGRPQPHTLPSKFKKTKNDKKLYSRLVIAQFRLKQPKFPPWGPPPRPPPIFPEILGLLEARWVRRGTEG